MAIFVHLVRPKKFIILFFFKRTWYHICMFPGSISNDLEWAFNYIRLTSNDLYNQRNSQKYRQVVYSSISNHDFLATELLLSRYDNNCFASNRINGDKIGLSTELHPWWINQFYSRMIFNETARGTARRGKFSERRSRMIIRDIRRGVTRRIRQMLRRNDSAPKVRPPAERMESRDPLYWKVSGDAVKCERSWCHRPARISHFRTAPVPAATLSIYLSETVVFARLSQDDRSSNIDQTCRSL